MALLQALQRLLIALDGGLQLADILGATLPEGSLGLAVALLALLGGGIDLNRDDQSGLFTIITAMHARGWRECGAPDYCISCKMLRTGFRPPFRFCVWAASWVKGSTSGSGVDTVELIEPSGNGSDLGTGSMTMSL